VARPVGLHASAFRGTEMQQMCVVTDTNGQVIHYRTKELGVGYQAGLHMSQSFAFSLLAVMQPGGRRLETSAAGSSGPDVRPQDESCVSPRHGCSAPRFGKYWTSRRKDGKHGLAHLT
jgi:hypothetical protein